MKKLHLLRLFEVFVYILPYVFVFMGSLFQPLDADLGWHLAYGEYFYHHLTPLRDNIYSASMQNFHWINSSWVTDIISYTAFKIDGFAGLVILSALVVTATFFFISKTFKLTFLKQAIFFPIILYLELPVNSVSFRGQQLSLLFLAILLYLLNTYEKIFIFNKIKRVYLIPVLFFIWINTHGEFLLGFGVMGIWVLGKLISDFYTTEKIQPVVLNRKKEKVRYVSPCTKSNILKAFGSIKFWTLILMASLLLTFINPFGPYMYKEAFIHIGNADLKYISEYLPFKELTENWRNMFLVGALLVFGIVILFLNEKLIKKLPNVLVVFVLFALTLWIKRFAWAFYYTTPAVLSPYLGFDKTNTRWGKATGILILFISAVIILTYKNPISALYTSNWDTYCGSYIGCSANSAEFLSKTKIKEPLWSNYNWGGWLIWNYPTVKPFIDGRMHLWRNSAGYSAFDEYYPLEQNEKDIDASRFNTVYAWRKKPIAERLVELIQEGKWKLLYMDNRAIIAERKLPYTSINLIR